jgi:photosystem II stability/assembly factor-like uncharacterized protein
MVQLNEGSGRLLLRVLLGFLLSLNMIAVVQAQDWQRLGPPGGMVLTLGIDASGAVYLGTADGHVFVKDNSGKPWELRGRIGNRTDAVVSRLVPALNQSGVVYAAIWYQQPGAGGGVFRSDDGARTWKLVGLPNEAVRALEITPSPTRVILAGTRSGVFRSTDEGNTWERITPVDDAELRNVDSLAVDPRDLNVIYTGTYHLPWKTTDGGKTWKSVTAGLIDDSDIMSLRVDATNPERVFLSACSGIYRSENQGGQWSKLQGIPYAARRTQAIVQDPQNPQTLYAGTTEGLWITRDAGETWERSTPKAWVVNTVAVLPDSGKERVLVGTESRGVQVSEDAGRTFVEHNDGFTHQVVSQLIGDPTDASHLLMLMERGGSLLWESHDAGETWTPATLMKAEDSSKAHFAADSMQRLYASPWGWMVRVSSPEQLWILERGTEKWREWKLRLPLDSPSPRHRSAKAPRQDTAIHTAGFFLPAGSEIEFSEQGAYVPTKDGLLRCTLAGNCVRLKAFGSGGAFKALLVSPDGSTLCVVLDGKLAMSVDGGKTATWSDLPVSSNNILWIRRLDGEKGQTLFLGTADGLFTSTDRGASWNRRERGLPAGQVEQVIQGHGFIAASLREGGMYISTDGGKTWDRTYPDAERSRFTGIVETSPGILTIGSQSEGVLRWQARSSKK